MNKKRVVVVGGGISGLTLAWTLLKTCPSLEVTILEKSARPGGWIQTQETDGFLFEQGPHVFKTSRCEALIRLATDLGLREKMIFSDPQAAHRFLYVNQTLHRFPAHPLAFFTSPLMKGIRWALVSEWAKSAQHVADESIWDFVARRFNVQAAERLVDPMVLGIYAGDVRRLSIRTCFPLLKEWEEKYGSVTQGMISSLKKKKKVQYREHALFSFEGGIATLIEALERELRAHLVLNQEVKTIRRHADQVVVITDKETILADHIFFATSPHQAAHIVEQQASEVAQLLRAIEMQSLTVVNLGYRTQQLRLRGFGYLIPSSEKEEVLGTLFDSQIFPSQNKKPEETRLTLMLRAGAERSEEESMRIGLEAVKRQLGIDVHPTICLVKNIPHALPQFTVGHAERISTLRALVNIQLSQCDFIGNYFEAASVDACISQAKQSAQVFLRS